MSADTDRNLLFGVLALQAGLLDARQFAVACSAWAAHKDTPLDDLLVEHGLLTTEDRSLLAALLEKNLKKHSGDARASLAAVAAEPARQALSSVGDPAIQESLCGFPTPEGPGLTSTTAYQPASQDRYTLTRMHATGGIGQVWLARDEALGREVALKELRPEKGAHPAALARFLEEAKITSQLQHPSIVPVYELSRGGDGKQPFYTRRGGSPNYVTPASWRSTTWACMRGRSTSSPTTSTAPTSAAGCATTARCGRKRPGSVSVRRIASSGLRRDGQPTAQRTHRPRSGTGGSARPSVDTCLGFPRGGGGRSIPATPRREQRPGTGGSAHQPPDAAESMPGRVVRIALSRLSARR
jgi:hypothetical protein